MKSAPIILALLHVVSVYADDGK